MAPRTLSAVASLCAAAAALLLGSGVDVIGYESSQLGLALLALGCLFLLVTLAFFLDGLRAHGARQRAVGQLAELVSEAKGLGIWQTGTDDDQASIEEGSRWVIKAVGYVLQALSPPYDQRLRTEAELPLVGSVTEDDVKAEVPLITYPNTHSIVLDRVSKVRYKLEAFMEEIEV